MSGFISVNNKFHAIAIFKNVPSITIECLLVPLNGSRHGASIVLMNSKKISPLTCPIVDSDV